MIAGGLIRRFDSGTVHAAFVWGGARTAQGRLKIYGVRSVAEGVICASNPTQ